jgi:hypothetical protein
LIRTFFFKYISAWSVCWQIGFIIIMSHSHTFNTFGKNLKLWLFFLFLLRHRHWGIFLKKINRRLPPPDIRFFKKFP